MVTWKRLHWTHQWNTTFRLYCTCSFSGRIAFIILSIGIALFISWSLASTRCYAGESMLKGAVLVEATDERRQPGGRDATEGARYFRRCKRGSSPPGGIPVQPGGQA